MYTGLSDKKCVNAGSKIADCHAYDCFLLISIIFFKNHTFSATYWITELEGQGDISDILASVFRDYLHFFWFRIDNAIFAGPILYKLLPYQNHYLGSLENICILGEPFRDPLKHLWTSGKLFS